MRDLELALKAAADPTRTRILKLLEAGPLCVCQIQAVLGLAPSTVSKHLTMLKIAGLAEDRRDGRWIRYTLATGGRNPHAAGVLALLRGTPDRDPRILADRRRLREVRAIPIDELCGVLPLAPPSPSPVRRERTKRKETRHA
jgi:ArsR family transcriptional regulator, arsenate/arsenite/antimonite-responsive transcriptional repressor